MAQLRYIYNEDLKDGSGKRIPHHVQVISYLIWTAPESDLSVRDLKRIFRKVCAHFGFRAGPLATWRFVFAVLRSGAVTRYWFRPAYYLNDFQMKERQIQVFWNSLRGTGFDKMHRIRRFYLKDVPYKRQGRETCDWRTLMGELSRIDVKGMLIP